MASSLRAWSVVKVRTRGRGGAVAVAGDGPDGPDGEDHHGQDHGEDNDESQHGSNPLPVAWRQVRQRYGSVIIEPISTIPLDLIDKGARLILMKRTDLMKRLRQHAKAVGQDMLVTEGGSHTKVVIGQARTVVPRHREINERTAQAILKQMGVKL